MSDRLYGSFEPRGKSHGSVLCEFMFLLSLLVSSTKYRLSYDYNVPHGSLDISTIMHVSFDSHYNNEIGVFTSPFLFYGFRAERVLSIISSVELTIRFLRL